MWNDVTTDSRCNKYYSYWPPDSTREKSANELGKVILNRGECNEVEV